MLPADEVRHGGEIARGGSLGNQQLKGRRNEDLNGRARTPAAEIILEGSVLRIRARGIARSGGVKGLALLLSLRPLERPEASEALHEPHLERDEADLLDEGGIMGEGLRSEEEREPLLRGESAQGDNGGARDHASAMKDADGVAPAERDAREPEPDERVGGKREPRRRSSGEHARSGALRIARSPRAARRRGSERQPQRVPVLAVRKNGLQREDERGRAAGRLRTK